MKINKTIIIVMVLFGLLVGGLGAGVLLTQQPNVVNAAPPVQQEDTEGNEANEGNETEEAVSPDQASITADQAKAAAEAAHSGSKAVAVELENETGKVTYEVELDNGLEVIVDAGNGDILNTQ